MTTSAVRSRAVGTPPRDPDDDPAAALSAWVARVAAAGPARLPDTVVRVLRRGLDDQRAS